MTPIAFYAPLKSPDHPVPSGDRTMARLFRSAWRQAGFDPVLASELRAFEPDGDADRQRAIAALGAQEAKRIVAACRERPSAERPAGWFTYHCYYKAPDWIGPVVADALRIPYLVAEGSRAGKRADGPFAFAHGGAEAALDRADALFAMSPVDREALEAASRPSQRLVDCPPFTDVAHLRSAPPRDASGPARLLTVAMMRQGDKLASYRLLAEALSRLSSATWTLDIVGDGPARTDVAALFAPLGANVRFCGQIDDPAALAAAYGSADLLVWPAVNEAFGLQFLEAQAMGCPVLAGREGGVASALKDGETGRLAPPRDAAAFAHLLEEMLADRPGLARMGAAAARFVRGERTVAQAATLLSGALAGLAGPCVR